MIYSQKDLDALDVCGAEWLQVKCSVIASNSRQSVDFPGRFNWVKICEEGISGGMDLLTSPWWLRRTRSFSTWVLFPYFSAWWMTSHWQTGCQLLTSAISPNMLIWHDRRIKRSDEQAWGLLLIELPWILAVVRNSSLIGERGTWQRIRYCSLSHCGRNSPT